MAICRMLDTSLVSADMREFTYHLGHDKMFLPDILRDTKKIMDTAQVVFQASCQPFAMVNGDNKLAGVFYLSDIVPGHDAVFYAWVWDSKSVTATTLPFMREYIEANADEYGLCRVVARTPDKRLCHLLEHLGFTLEGRFKSGFKHGGKLMTLFQLRRLFGR